MQGLRAWLNKEEKEPKKDAPTALDRLQRQVDSLQYYVENTGPIVDLIAEAKNVLGESYQYNVENRKFFYTDWFSYRDMYSFEELQARINAKLAEQCRQKHTKKKRTK